MGGLKAEQRVPAYAANRAAEPKRSYGCANVNGAEQDCYCFFEELNRREKQNRGPKKSQQDERLFPQAVYAHIRGLVTTFS